ncbi:MAG TPA: TMEM175 family protein [Pyrinomonadaceae bacterium]|nr:TMEM175 family protein [Pyrinomonadaceae bacterium]
MSTTRLEAFSDGVIAILITIMVLELRAPHDSSLAALRPLWPVFLSYVMSFIYLGIYWNNHHHLLHASEHVNGRILWANLHLLFWLSLIPFTTAWMGENHFGGSSVALYGVVLLCAAISYFILVRALLALHGSESVLAAALGSDFKGKISIVFYLVAIALTFINNWIGFAIYVLVAIMWLVPDKRIERQVGHY